MLLELGGRTPGVLQILFWGSIVIRGEVLKKLS